MAPPNQSAASAASSANVVDPLDLLDFTEYDGLPTGYQHSPSMSPPTSNKQQFPRPTSSITTPATLPSTLPSSQSMPGPSHQYDQYKQQTPFVPGALASTLAVNQNNAHINGGYNLEYMSPADDVFDFNAPPSHPPSSTVPDMEVDFESPAAENFFYPESTVNPNAIDGQTLPSPTVPSQTSNVGRMYPGMHQQQAALAKAQQQQRQQQQIIQQQQQQQQQQQHQRQASQVKQNQSKQPFHPDPIVEQKISSLLHSMRSKPDGGDGRDNSPLMQIPRPKKDEDEMDEDERLLASEEGKKLSSKERRQLRNKVSARAFRSRRKEYISQLESEIATKVTENGELRAQNRALVEENRRLADLTRMLLSSASFSNFLDHLSQNPAGHPQGQPQPQPQQQPVTKIEPRQSEQQQIPKDINPYAAVPHTQPQTIGMAMIPEQTMDFSMLNLESESSSFNYQPQVFTVVEAPEMPEIDASLLSGKAPCAVDEGSSDNEKIEAPVIESPIPAEFEKTQNQETSAEPSSTVSVLNLDGDIYDDVDVSPPTKLEMDSLSLADMLNGIVPAKASAHFVLVDASEKDALADRAVKRVERLSASIEASLTKLERLTIGL